MPPGAPGWHFARRAPEGKALHQNVPGAALLLILAPFVGSFLGVVARRVPRGESIVRPRSHCEACGHVLRARELVPVASFLVLRGRAACCGAPIAASHLAIELFAVLVPAILLAVAPGLSPELALAGTVLGWWLLVLAAIDLACWRLPDALTLTLLLAGLAASWALAPPADPLAAVGRDPSFAFGGRVGRWLDAVPDGVIDHAEAAVIGFACLALLASLYRRVRGRDGIGMGDAKLLAAGGAWCGLSALAPIVLVGAGAGIVFGLARHGRSARGATMIPFGPTLALAIWVVWVMQLG